MECINQKKLVPIIHDNFKRSIDITKASVLLGLTSLLTSFTTHPVYADGVISGVTVEDGNITIDVGKAGVDKSPDDVQSAFNTLFEHGELIITGLTGILSIVMVGVFAFKAFKLAQAGDNPKERSKAISGLIYSAIGTALMGSATLFMGYAFNLFN